MQQEEKLKYLKVALIVFGIIFIAGIYVMMKWVWPSGWGWTPRQPEYEQMIMGVYATLGVFLIRAAKDPLANASLIWFTIWSSIVHGGIMLVQAIVDETERANLLGDVPALILIGVLGKPALAVPVRACDIDFAVAVPLGGKDDLCARGGWPGGNSNPW